MKQIGEMKKKAAAILLGTAMLAMAMLCGCKDVSVEATAVSPSDTGEKTVAYLPYNCFSDTDGQNAYFALNPRNEQHGIYRKALHEDKSGNYVLLYGCDGEITSLAVWRQYVYFLLDGSLCRVSSDGTNFMELIPAAKLQSADVWKNGEKRKEIAAMRYLRVAGNWLYADYNHAFTSCRVYDLWQNDMAQIRIDTSGEGPMSSPFCAECENWAYTAQYADDAFSDEDLARMRFAMNPCIVSGNGEESFLLHRSFFDYQCQTFLYAEDDCVKVFGLDGALIKTVPITQYPYPNGQYRVWPFGNVWNGRLYRFAASLNNSESSQQPALIELNVEKQTEQLILIPQEYRIYRRYTDLDVIDHLVYWRNESGELICCDPEDGSVFRVTLTQ